VTPSLIGRFEHHDTLEGAPEGFSVPWRSLVYDLSLARAKAVSRPLPSAEAAMPLVASR